MKLMPRFFLYVCIFLGLSFVGIIGIYAVVWVIETYLQIQLTEWKWLLFGLFLGTAFSFFVAIIPPMNKNNLEYLKKSFCYYLTYFGWFILSISAFELIIILIIVSYKIIVH